MLCMNKQPQTSPIWLRRLIAPTRIDSQPPVAARFIYALRLLAVYQAAGRDPAAELAVRLGSVTAAVHTIELSRELVRAWPDRIAVGRFCCAVLSHDEASIARMLGAALRRDRYDFSAELADLVRPARIARLWEHCVMLVGAEISSAVSSPYSQEDH